MFIIGFSSTGIHRYAIRCKTEESFIIRQCNEKAISTVVKLIIDLCCHVPPMFQLFSPYVSEKYLTRVSW